MTEITNSRSANSSDLQFSSRSSNSISDEKILDKKESKFWLDPEEYTLQKRLPPTLPKRNSDVYVTNKTNFKAQLVRCQRLIDEGIKISNTSSDNQAAKNDSCDKNVLVYLHAIGAAIPRALNLALQLQRNYGSRVVLDTATSTVELTDDFEPVYSDNANYKPKETITHTRYNSAIHIKISHVSIPSTGMNADASNLGSTPQEQ